jgi:HSP20 family molecular chaperone IbpA
MNGKCLNPESAFAMFGGKNHSHFESARILPEIEACLDDLLSSIVSPNKPGQGNQRRQVHPHNIFTSIDHIRIEIPVPGFNDNDIHVSTENAVLTIKVGDVDAKDVKEESDETCIHRGFNKDPFELTFDLPMNHRPDNISVQLVNGILTVFINRSEEF